MTTPLMKRTGDDSGDDKTVAAPKAKKGKAAKKKAAKEEKAPVKKSSKKKSSGKMTGYAYFCREHREEVKEENPDMKSTEVTKKLSTMWKALNKDEKQEWTEDAKAQE